jgi:hypothetical protein
MVNFRLDHNDLSTLSNFLNTVKDDALKEILTKVIHHEKNNAYYWDEYIIQAHEMMIKMSNTKEIGKVRAYASELMLRDYINNYLTLQNINSVCIHNDNLTDFPYLMQELGIKLDSNQSGFDLLLINQDNMTAKKIQVKHRSSNIHLETTRRNSAKNKGKNQTGHVRYGADEFDYLIVVKGKLNNIVNMTNDIIIFPIEILIDSDHNNVLITGINKKTEATYAKNVSLMFENMLS